MNEDAQILNNWGLIELAKKINTGQLKTAIHRILLDLFFFKIPSNEISPDVCRIELNCSDPTISPITTISSPEPVSLEEWKFVR